MIILTYPQKVYISILAESDNYKKEPKKSRPNKN